MTEPLPHNQTDSVSLLDTVGQRVYQTRRERGLSRRLLSERSGVSPRYIAQLESGAGNISIALLYKIAAALECNMGWLLSESGTTPANGGSATGSNATLPADVLQLLQSADNQTLEQVRQLLKERVTERAQRICLIGLRGAGKSTIGRLAGDALQVPFIELNSQIEIIAGMPVAEIIALYGAQGYRDLESEALEAVIAQHNRVLLAAAGGVVSNPATFNMLLSRFHCVWLKARPEDHMQRVLAQGDTRPMKGNPAAMQQLKALLEDREARYSKAPLLVDTSGTTKAEALKSLLEQLKKCGIPLQ